MTFTGNLTNGWPPVTEVWIAMHDDYPGFLVAGLQSWSCAVRPPSVIGTSRPLAIQSSSAITVPPARASRRRKSWPRMGASRDVSSTKGSKMQDGVD
jgi:hypothetical protein